MDGGEKDLPSFWVDESQELLSVPMKMKRKARTKKMEFVGWGSKPLIEFLESIGKDTSKQISQYEMTSIINEYVNTNNLINPQKKKRIMCDERLHYLFGKKSLVRIKIYDLLETHFAENQDESEDGFFYSSEDNNEATLMVREQQKASASDRKHHHQRKKVPETPKSCFAAIISANIKLVYLKRSLVLDLQKDPETFEGKVVGSFVRVKSDPNDYFQKNSHQLLQVTGVRKDSGTDNTCTVCLLQVSNVMKDIHISMLSDDNFSEEECEDVRQRVKNGSLKRPTVVEFQEKAQILHEDITKHWLVRELTLLQNLIDRANEKGWRRELDEYLNKRQLLQSPCEQSRLLLEVPKVIAEEIEQEATLQEGTNGSPRSILGGASEISTSDLEANPTLSTRKFGNADAAGSADILTASIVVSCDSFLARDENKDFASEDASIEVPKADENNAEGRAVQFVQQMMPQINLEEPKVIDLSDDDYNDREDEDPFGRSIWHYMDPQGNAQGPFPVESLKRWSDANYFPPDFKVWKTGQSHEEAVLLSNVLLQMFHDSYE